MEEYQLPQGEPYELPRDKVPINNRLFPKQTKVFPTYAQINPAQYSLIQDEGKVVTISALQQYNGSNFANLNTSASTDKLVLATPKRFLTSWRDVNSALRGETARYNASGELIQPSQLARDAQVVNNAWVYLNARFPQTKNKGFRGLDLVTIILDKDGKPVFTRVPLETCLEEGGCLADIESINTQGLPTKKAKTKKYEPGKTFNFYPPVLRTDKPQEGWVARFDAYSDRAILYCIWHPDIVISSLGGFVCAEGASEKNVGKE